MIAKKAALVVIKSLVISKWMLTAGGAWYLFSGLFSAPHWVGITAGIITIMLGMIDDHSKGLTEDVDILKFRYQKTRRLIT